MSTAKLSLALAALALSAPVAFAQTAAQTPLSQEPTREQRQGLNPLQTDNPHVGAGKVDPGGVSGTGAGRTTATGGNPGGPANRN